MLPELRLIRALVGINLASAMEYRVSFISQIIGMAVNNGVMLVFWFIFFDRFGTIEGYAFEEMFLLFGLVALSYGVAHTLAGNIGGHLAYLIAQGRLDYYLVFPRRLLPHILFSRMQISAVGDLLFGLVCVALAIGADGWRWVWALLGTWLAAAVIVAYGVIAGSLSLLYGQQPKCQPPDDGVFGHVWAVSDELFFGWGAVGAIYAVASGVYWGCSRAVGARAKRPCFARFAGRHGRFLAYCHHPVSGWSAPL
ncbi:MAG: ABC-2 family transporter protein [Chloroflexi bacterium]|nr:ABC-2 family transporter protein [Chloroflexota bacterium]